MPNSVGKKHVLLVTGLAGAGRTTALKILEDAGYVVIDNMPMRLAQTLFHEPSALPDKIALGTNIATDDMTTHFLPALEDLKASKEIVANVIFLQADDDVLLRRYKETRRKHPLHDGRPVLEVIAAERQILDHIRQVADTSLDTSHFKPADLKRYLLTQFSEESKKSDMAVFVMSFGFKHGAPKEADLMFDVRFLRNPHYDPDLRPHTGLEKEVCAYIAEDENLVPTQQNMMNLLKQQVPLFQKEGKAYLTVAIGCTGGKHRSVMMTEFVGKTLKQEFDGKDLNIQIHHRDIDNIAG